MKVLKINSSVQPLEVSVTRQLVEDITSKLTGAEDKVIERDLTQGVSLLTGELVGSFFTKPEERNERQKEILKESDQLVKEVIEADAIVLGAPIYNFSVPASVKAYFDLISRAGLTFKYDENGPQGLLENKPVYVVTASGSTSLGADVDFLSSYVKQFFAFLGVSNVNFVDATGLKIDEKASLERAKAQVEALV